MSAKQKILACRSNGAAFTDQLNLEAEQGWRIQTCSTKVDMSGNRAHETKADTHLFVLEKSESKYCYFCRTVNSYPTASVENLNAALEEQAEDGWRLIAMLHSWGIKGPDQIGLQTHQRYFLVFEKEVGS